MKYEEAAKLWGAKKLDESGVAYDAVSHVSFYTSTDIGCPTCGPETRHEATVWYHHSGGRQSYKEYTYFGLDDILQELFEISE